MNEELLTYSFAPSSLTGVGYMRTIYIQVMFESFLDVSVGNMMNVIVTELLPHTSSGNHELRLPPILKFLLSFHLILEILWRGVGEC